MKTYINAVAFTLSVGLIFLISSLSSSFLTEDSVMILKLHTLPYGVPTENGFMLLWGIVYLCSGILISITIANKCLRRAIKIWGLLGIINLLFTFTYFKLNLSYFGLALISVSLILLTILTSFYVKNTRAFWILTIPILAVYGYSTFLAITLI